MTNENKDLEKNVIKFFGPLFSQVSKFLKTKDWFEVEVFDTPSQFFLFGETNTSVYWRLSEEQKQIINKIVKENKFDELTQENILLEDLTQFRRLFRKHPEMEMQLYNLVEKNVLIGSVEALNIFFNEMIKLKIYTDENLVNIREFRIYIAKKSIAMVGALSEDLKNDLYYFLDFERFNTDEYMEKKADEVLNYICEQIEIKSCPDLRNMKTYSDWDVVPMEIISKIERLVLINYCDKPDKKVVNEIRMAADTMNLDMLKNYLGFIPKWWQKYALIFESRENLAANCRRSWKTFLIVYIVIRQIFLPWQMILYMLPNKEDYSEQPFFYIEQMLENVKKLGAELPWFQFNAKQFRIVNKIFKSKIIFLSAQGASKGKSFSCNLGIMDEAAYIDNPNTYDQLSNSTGDTKGRMRAISTINVETPINWFFFKKVSLEGMEDCRVHSVDIYNNPFMSKEEKERTERKYKNKNQNVWLADWMAIFVWGADWFDISNFFKIDFTYDVLTFKWCRFNVVRNLDKYSRFLICYDPAKTMDKAGVAMIGLYWKKAEVCMTGYIDIKNYFLQREVLIDALEYIAKMKQIELGVDLGKAWEAAFDYFESRKFMPYWIISTGGNNVNKQTYRRWNVPEQILEKTLHTMMSAGVVTWFSWLDNIRNEFETYNLSKERKWNVWHHHDVLSALMLAVFIWYERWFIGIEIKKWEEKKETLIVDSNGVPIKQIRKWQFNWTLMGRFIY